MNNQSECINELAAALSKAQGEMQAAIKDSINPFFKSKYADLGSVWDAARPVLCKHGLCIMQTTDVLGDKNILITTLAHSSGQWMKSSILINPTKNDSQGVGAAMTYLRRYSLAAMVGVVTEDDDGETAVGRGQSERKQEQPKKPKPENDYLPIPTNLVNTPNEKHVAINRDQLDTILEILPKVEEKCRANMWKYLNNQDIYSPEEIHQSLYKGVINSLKLNLEKQKAYA